MGKLTVVSVLAFLLMLGSTANSIAHDIGRFKGEPGLRHLLKTQSDDGIRTEIEMWQSTFSNGVYYGINFRIDGNDVRKILIMLPNGKNMFLNNTINLNDFDLEAWRMNYEEFNYRFPEGKYYIILLPQWKKSLRFNITHDFPSTPVITYPDDGATGVPLNLTVEWETLGTIDDLGIELGSEGIHFDIILPTDATSFTFPSGMLQPNTTYQLDLYLSVEEETSYGSVYDIESSRVIYFTTGTE